MKKIVLISTLVACVVGGAIFGAGVWRAQVIARLEERAFNQATRLLQQGRALEALAVADEQGRSDVKFAWSRLELEALVNARHITRLVAVFGSAPERILASEEGSLLVARAFFAARQHDDFKQLRAKWRGREARHELWLALDSDILGLEGRSREAEQLLNSRKFEGAAEATRLVRLALHAVPRSLYESWSLLDRAYALTPRNPEIRSFRAQILEAIGKPSEARVEYVAAVVAEPNNPLLRDELAEFYRRQGSYELALQTWREALVIGAPDFVALKEAFWGRVIQPAVRRPGSKAPSGSLGPLAEFVRSLPDHRFWDAEAFGRLAQNERLARERQEVFWLQLLELLRAGQEREAAEKLQANPFQSRSWRPELETGLARILSYRAHGSLSSSQVAAGSGITGHHPFLKGLQSCARTEAGARKAAPMPKELSLLLTSKNAFAAALLAAGWREAVLILVQSPAEAEVPAWFSFGLAQSLRINRGNAASLAYVSRQPRTPELVVLHGELLLAEKQLAAGTGELEGISRHDSDAGCRAGWLLAQSAIDSGELARAREIIERQPRLSTSTPGRELLARIALLGGNLVGAEQMFQAISADSVEARAFLARRAFQQGNWSAAREHTTALQRLLPDELQLRDNLMAIAKAEQSHEKR